MKLLSFTGRALLHILGTALLLLVLLAGFVLYRVMSFEQLDDQERIANKQAYLEGIAAMGKLPASSPNIVFILYDDMGYGDIGVGAVGSEMIDTPNIDRLAENGVMLSDFHSPAPVCTPSRAGFLTGRLPARAGLPNVVFPTGSAKEFVFSKILAPGNNQRLPAEEITLADVLKAAGYATGMVGKWHLGDSSPSLPNDMGFDSYFGALYSNDMKPFALYRNRDIAIPAPVDQRDLSKIYDREVTGFIKAQQGKPFFLYFAHNFPHRPLFVRDERSGGSPAGLYGDVLEELDEGVGEIISTLEAQGELDNTLIIISSDNGPWYLGDPGDHRGRKGNTFEGGMRVPFIAHWPGRIPAGEVEEAMAMGTDLLPTVLELLALPAPGDRVLDGRSILPILTKGAPTPHDFLYYFDGETLFAARDQRFKYRGPAGVMYATDQMPVGGNMGKQKEWLFDLVGDRRESYDTSNHNPDELSRLRAAFQAKQVEMADNKRGWL
jgi:arylsulfatase A-like enzyme